MSHTYVHTPEILWTKFGSRNHRGELKISTRFFHIFSFSAKNRRGGFWIGFFNILAEFNIQGVSATACKQYQHIKRKDSKQTKLTHQKKSHVRMCRWMPWGCGLKQQQKAMTQCVHHIKASPFPLIGI